MRTLYKILLFSTVVLALSSCGKNDARQDYGFPLVYIPQATVTGLDNSYPIPLGPFYRNSTYTCSYDAASGVLNIVVGVIRSGYLANQQAFSVKLGTSESETARKLGEYAEKAIPASALPASVCNIPARISVESGNNGGTCHVGVDLKALSQQRSAFYSAGTYDLLVLGLEISDLQGPSEYRLADSNTRVVIVLDLGSEEWDNVEADKPESKVRELFPFD